LKNLRRESYFKFKYLSSFLEYIIFRGADIFDLTVCDLPQDRLPQDPAILTAAQQPPAPIGSQQAQYPPNFNAQSNQTAVKSPVKYEQF
jgi:hypothetical protein